VPEKEIADVAVGEPIVLKTRAYPQWRLTGRVLAIGTVAQQDVASADAATTHPDPANKFVLVTTHLDNPGLKLKPQMTGAAKIQCGQRRIGDLVMRSLSRTLRVEFWSWW
jgi:multidrug resistance efflux pump